MEEQMFNMFVYSLGLKEESRQSESQNRSMKRRVTTRG